jgi:type I restriction enzyme S subunit
MHKNENRPGYKKTKVGWIPDGWALATYRGSFSVIMDGTHFSPKTTSGTKKYLTSRNIRKGTLDLTDCSYISVEEHAEIYRKCPVRFGQVLLTKDGANAGNACINTLAEEFSLLSSVAVLDGTPEILTNRYAIQWILSPKGQAGLLSTIAGQAITRFTLQAIAGVAISLPPLPEQEAIAEVLECWDKGIRNLELKIVKKRLIKKGLMQKLLSGQTRLPGFSKDWKNVRLGDVLSIGNGRDYKHLSDGNIPVFGTGGLMTHVNGKLHSGETVFIGRKGTINKPFYYNGDFWTVDTLFFTHKFKNAFPQFIYALFQKINWEKHSEASGVPSLSKTVILKIEVKLPPLEEQRAIAKILAAADGEIEMLERKLALWKDQKKFLLNNLVTGTIRLPEFKN